MRLTVSLSPTSARPSAPALAGVLIAHAGLLAWLTRAPAPPTHVEPPRPLIVQLIAPARNVVIAPPRTPRRLSRVTRSSTVQASPPRTPPPPPPQPRPESALPPDPLPMPSLERALAAPAPTPPPERSPLASTPAEPVVKTLEAAQRSSEIAPRALATTPPQAADYLNNPSPQYPALSRRFGEEGTVRLRILVNAEGGVDRLELDRSSGHPRLDRAAMETVLSTWKFEPARQAGSPVKAWAVVPIQFTLRR